MAIINPLGSIELDLEKIVKIVRDFLSVDRKTKDKIIKFIVQTEKAYGLIVKTIAPFYVMQYTDDAFLQKFPTQYSIFMEGFHDNLEIRAVRYACSDVQNDLANIATSKKFRMIPFARKKLEGLKALADMWILRDYTVSDTLQMISNEFELQLDYVSLLLKQGKVQEARNKLQVFVSDTKGSFERIKTLLFQLGDIKQKLN